MWRPLLIILVITIAGVAVHRMQGVFGRTELTREGSGLINDPKPTHPMRVTYDIFGAGGTVATINYLDLDSYPQEVKDAPLPWSMTLTTTDPAAGGYIVAQGNGNRIGCRITIDDKVEAEKTSDGVHAQTFCLVTAA